MTQMAAALEALFVANVDFEVVEKSREVFCPFEAVGMVRQEIKHGHFLAYCLDPQRPHGFGSECLRALMRAAAHAQRSSEGKVATGHITPLDVHLMDFEQAQIRREWRSIDLLAVVSDEKLVVAIELKIDAGEHSGQLRRYRDTVTEEWPVSSGWRHVFLFLTKHGDDASNDDGDGWLTLPLDSVARHFDEVVRKQVGAPDARTLLAAYLSMLRRHHLPDEKLEELAAKLWSQHREALEFLMERRPDSGEGVFGQLFQVRQELAEKMSVASALEIVPDDSTLSILRFAVRDWDGLPDFLTAENWTSSNRIILIELQRNNEKTNVRIRFALGPGKHATRLRYYDTLLNSGVLSTNKKVITQQWTRLRTKSIELENDEDQESPTARLERICQRIEEYAKKVIPEFNIVLSALAGTGQSGATQSPTQ